MERAAARHRYGSDRRKAEAASAARRVSSARYRKLRHLELTRTAPALCLQRLVLGPPVDWLNTGRAVIVGEQFVLVVYERV